MNYRKINKKVIELLRGLSDNNSLQITQNKHLKIKGSFGGTQKTIVLFCSPSSCYQKYLRSTLRRFLKDLDKGVDLTPIF